MTDLTGFLLARIAEDEEAARVFRDRYRHLKDASGRPLASTEPLPPALTYDRVLAECEAKRRIVALHTPLDGEECDPSCGEIMSPCPTLAALALPYADHTDYREEWRP